MLAESSGITKVWPAIVFNSSRQSLRSRGPISTAAVTVVSMRLQSASREPGCRKPVDRSIRHFNDRVGERPQNVVVDAKLDVVPHERNRVEIPAHQSAEWIALAHRSSMTRLSSAGLMQSANRVIAYTGAVTSDPTGRVVAKRDEESRGDLRPPDRPMMHRAMDFGAAMRNTGSVVRAGALRDRLAGILKAAFADGLLSEQTLAHRLSALFDQRLVDPDGVVGDLSLRSRIQQRGPSALTPTAVAAYQRVTARKVDTLPEPLVLALDWLHGESSLVIGRDAACDVVLADDSVSRHHARLVFRDGTWIIQDLDSKNGTIVNRKRVGRSQLHPGDRLQLGDLQLDVD